MPNLEPDPKTQLAGFIDTLDLLVAQARAYERTLHPDNYLARAAVASMGKLARQALNEAQDLAAQFETKLMPDHPLSPRELEVLQLVQLMNNSYHLLATLYADSPEDVLTRLESMCLMANPNFGLDEIRRMIASAIGLITFQQNHVLPDYRIKITRMVEVSGVENDRYVTPTTVYLRQ